MKKMILSTLFALAAVSLQAESFKVDFSNPAIVVTKPEEISVNVQTGPGVYYNSYYKHSWIMHYNGRSFIEVKFTNNLPEGQSASLDFVHLASLVGNIYYAPISISVNGNQIASHFSPADANYISDSFDITQFVKTGENTIRVTFDNDAICNYWIQKLEVNFQ